jgi:DNA-directed RNA polymerase subunit RPC12/RpoP
MARTMRHLGQLPQGHGGHAKSCADRWMLTHCSVISSCVHSAHQHPGNMALNEDSAACASCGDLVLLSAFVSPRGDDWRGLLGMEGSADTVCPRCKSKIATKRRTARARALTTLPLSEAQAAVQPAALHEPGWGVSSSCRRCVHSPSRLACL